MVCRIGTLYSVNLPAGYDLVHYSRYARSESLPPAKWQRVGPTNSQHVGLVKVGQAFFARYVKRVQRSGCCIGLRGIRNKSVGFGEGIRK